MAAPPIPLDIASLVVDSLIRDLDWPERAKQGGTISLVCRAWRPLGEALSWRRVEITLGEVDKDERVLLPLEKRPHALDLVQSLKISHTRTQKSEQSSAMSVVHRLAAILSLAANLRHLSLRAAVGVGILLTSVAASPSAPSLETLEISCAVAHASLAEDGGAAISSFPFVLDLDTFPLEDRLTAFTGLKHLSGIFFALGSGALPAPSTPLTQALRLASLTVRITGAGVGHAAQEAAFVRELWVRVGSVVDPTSVRACILFALNEDLALLDLVRQFVGLQDLRIGSSPVVLCTILDLLTKTISALPLCRLTIDAHDPFPPTLPYESHLGALRLLNLIPLSVRQCSLHLDISLQDDLDGVAELSLEEFGGGRLDDGRVVFPNADHFVTVGLRVVGRTAEVGFCRRHGTRNWFRLPDVRST